MSTFYAKPKTNIMDMNEATKEVITDIIALQKRFFATGETKPIDFRIENLKRFKTAILKYEKRIADALYTDLHKSYEEAYLTEISIVTAEIGLHIRKLRRWAKATRKSPHYPRIVNRRAYDRLCGLMRQGHIVYGGDTDEEERFFAPTFIDNILLIRKII